MALPHGTETRGGLARRERLLRDLPSALDKEEARLFALAKRIEAGGDRAKADLFFELSRKAFETRASLRRDMDDEALEQAHRLLVRLQDTR